MKPSFPVLVGLAALFSPGCGKSGAEKFADSFCAEIAKCCGQAGLPSNGNMCHLMMSGGSYNSQAGDACLAEMKSEVAGGTFCTNLGSPACDSVSGSVGSKKPGDVCVADSDCAPSSDGKVACASVYVNSAFIQKCQVQVPGKVGDACDGTQDGNLFLSSSSTDATDVAPRIVVCNTSDGVQCKSNTCTALAVVGASCGYTPDCVRSAFCDPGADKCAAKVAAGNPCPSGDDEQCLDGNYCAAGTNQCAAKGENGAACTTANMCLSSNCPSDTCQSNGLDTLVLALICGS